VRQLLRLAGIDSRDQSQVAAARALLQGGSLASTPRRIAEAIARERGLPRSEVPRILRLIRSLDGSPEALVRFDRIMGRGASPQPADS